MLDFITWWCYRRWTIYCPSYQVDHLFEQNRKIVLTPMGWMEFPSDESFEKSLFHYDEEFISPCTWNEINCGVMHNKWMPKIAFMPGMEDREEETQDE